MTNENDKPKPTEANFTEDVSQAGKVAIDACDADVQARLRALNQEDDEIVLEQVAPVNGREVFAIRCTDLGMQAMGLVFNGSNARDILRANAIAKATRKVMQAVTDIVGVAIDGDCPTSDVSVVSGLATGFSTGVLDGAEVPKDKDTVMQVAQAYQWGSAMASKQLPDTPTADAVSEALRSVLDGLSDDGGDDAEGECGCEACTMRREMAAKAGMTVDELDELMAMTNGKTVGEA